jgi:hypothetical protein
MPAATTGHKAAAFTCQSRIDRITAYEYVQNYGANETLHLYATVLADDREALHTLSKKDVPLRRVRLYVNKLAHHMHRFESRMTARSLALHGFETTVCSMTPGQRATQWMQIHALSSKLHHGHASLHHVARTLKAAIVRADHHLPGRSPR